MNPIRKRRTATTASFTPPQLSSLKARWRAAVGTFTDTGLTTAATADGTAVGGWSDPVGGFNATQATGGNQPVLKLGIFKGMPGLLFTAASSQFFSANALAATYSGAAKPYTLISVFKLNSTAATRVMIGMGRSSNANPFTFIFSDATAAYDVQSRADAGGLVTVTSAALASTTATECLIATFDGATVSIYAGGLLVAGPTAPTLTAETLDNLVIGAKTSVGAQSLYFDGYHAEDAAYSVGLTAGEVRQWAQYAAVTYGASLR